MEGTNELAGFQVVTFVSERMVPSFSSTASGITTYLETRVTNGVAELCSISSLRKLCMGRSTGAGRCKGLLRLPSSGEAVHRPPQGCHDGSAAGGPHV